MIATVVAGCFIATAISIFVFWRLLYNLHWHPLAKFPGPWWSRASILPEIYFDVVLGGRYFQQVENMHKLYGPIVRVTPEELSILDPDFYEHLFGGIGARRDLNKKQTRLSAAPTSVLATVDHDHHRIRRAPLLSFFSKQAVARLEPYIWSRMAMLVRKLEHAHNENKVVSTMDAYGALTTDIISHYAYGKSFEYLDDGSDFKNDYMRNISGLVFAGPLMVHFPVIAHLFRCLPQRILTLVNSGMAAVSEIRRQSAMCAISTLQHMNTHKHEHQPSIPKTIFQALADSRIPLEERSLQRLTDEGLVVMIAGLETTARFLTSITYHLLSNPEILSKLRTELRSVMATPYESPSLDTLEGLPYLSAVIREGLRCERFMTMRVARVLREPLTYKDMAIPAGTTVSCAPYLQNNHPDVFPDPTCFRPERWIEAREQGKNLDKYLGTFAKGSRMCAGINLAYAELYLTIAAIFRKFDMELVNSSVEDITAYRDFCFGFSKDYTFGIDVKIKEILKD